MLTNAEIKAFYEENYDDYVRRVKNRVGGIPNAEDVIQESFARALQYKENFDPKIRELGAWFNTILNNATRDFKRTERLQGLSTDDGLTPTMETQMLDEELLAILAEELSELPDREAEAMNLYLVRGLSGKEVAEITSYSPNTIRKMAHEFRAKIREDHGSDMRW